MKLIKNLLDIIGLVILPIALVFIVIALIAGQVKAVLRGNYDN